MIKAHYKSYESTILIVGGNSGIGIALSKILIDIGASIISIDIQEESALSDDSLIYYTAQPQVKSSLKNVKNVLLENNTSLIGLVNLSGSIKYFGPIETASADDWDITYDISFLSCLHSCQVFTSLLDKEHKPAIVNMSSGLAFIGQKNYGPYAASKAAIVSLTKTLAVELAPHIRVNCVAPGAVDTSFLKKEDGTTRVNLDNYKKLVPLGHIAQPLEIAHVIMFLLSDGASHITSECIHINGGAG